MEILLIGIVVIIVGALWLSSNKKPEPIWDNTDLTGIPPGASITEAKPETPVESAPAQPSTPTVTETKPVVPAAAVTKPEPAPPPPVAEKPKEPAAKTSATVTPPPAPVAASTISTPAPTSKPASAPPFPPSVAVKPSVTTTTAASPAAVQPPDNKTTSAEKSSGAPINGEATPGDSSPRVADLLRQAAAQQKDKNWDGAIATLREAETIMKASPYPHALETYLRLPSYLHKAGRYDQTLAEFNRLIEETPRRIEKDYEYSEKSVQMGLIYMDKSEIYEKMSQTCQKKKANHQALHCRLMAQAALCLGNKYKQRSQELRSARSKKSWQSILDGFSMISKDQKTQALEKCLEFSESCTDADFASLNSALSALLKS